MEIFPDLVDGREILTTHQINIDVEPAEIVWSKRPVDVEERKDNLRSLAKAEFKSVIDEEINKEIDQWPETQYDAAIVEAARGVFEARMGAIDAAKTHEDVDALSVLY